MTRLELTTAIYAYLHRGNFTTPVPNFDAVSTWIQLAEGDINLDMRARCMIRRATQPIEGQYIPLPCDYLEADDLRLSTGRHLTYMDRSHIGDLAQQQSNTTIIDPSVIYAPVPTGPRFFSVVGDLVEIWPYAADDPSGPYTVEMAYFASQSLGTDDTDTTDVLTALPGAYLWGALKYSAPFLRDDPRIDTWSAAYNAIVAKANLAKERAASAGSPIVQRYRRVG